MKGVVLLYLLLAFTTVWAADEPGQAQEPIFIESDSLNIDDSKGVSVYRGNVNFRQGGASLTADELTIYARQRQEVEKIIAVGSPARFEQLAQKEGEQDSSGEAKRIEYRAADGRVILDGDARFQQGDSYFAGSRVEYDSEKKLVRAGKNVAGEGRVQIMIQPRSGNGKDAE